VAFLPTRADYIPSLACANPGHFPAQDSGLSASGRCGDWITFELAAEKMLATAPSRGIERAGKWLRKGVFP
jgi:hypothetical protein